MLVITVIVPRDQVPLVIAEGLGRIITIIIIIIIITIVAITIQIIIQIILITIIIVLMFIILNTNDKHDNRKALAATSASIHRAL